MLRVSPDPLLIEPTLWARAGWIATAYVVHPDRAPVLALVFRDGDAASDIFMAWRAALGEIDARDRLRLAIVEGRLPMHPPGYVVHVGGSNDRGEAWLHVPDPDPAHLARFKAAYAVHGRYLLVPATVGAGLELMPRLGLGKERLALRRVSDVGLVRDPEQGMWSWCGVLP